MTISIADPAQNPKCEPLIFTARDLCSLLQWSLAKLHRQKITLAMPRPISRPGKKLEWNAAEIREWVDAGKPDLKTWEAIRKANNGRR